MIFIRHLSISVPLGCPNIGHRLFVVVATMVKIETSTQIKQLILKLNLKASLSGMFPSLLIYQIASSLHSQQVYDFKDVKLWSNIW